MVPFNGAIEKPNEKEKRPCGKQHTFKLRKRELGLGVTSATLTRDSGSSKGLL